MSWRTVVISQRCKLDYKMGYLVVRGETIQRIFLDEIAVLMIENPAVAMTGVLLEAMVEKKIRVIFCDTKRSPMAELAPYYGSHDSARKIDAQISWSESQRGMVWTEIIAAKLRMQADFLAEQGFARETALIRSYIPQLELFDATNREGHAAKVYFNALFGMDFTRSSDSPVNAALNYGYSIILSAFNREITANGYLTQIGLKHHNSFNYYNLSSDLMEPFRVLIDRKVHDMNIQEFSKDEKYELVRILAETVRINNSCQTVLNAIRIYTKSVFDAINNEDIAEIHLYEVI